MVTWLELPRVAKPPKGAIIQKGAIRRTGLLGTREGKKEKINAHAPS